VLKIKLRNKINRKLKNVVSAIFYCLLRVPDFLPKNDKTSEQTSEHRENIFIKGYTFNVQ
jgi:hypothetical protein